MADYTLTVFGDDDATPLFEVGTAADHDYPYLYLPGPFEEASVDLVRGGAVIGQHNLRIIDPQNGATQLERWMTSKLPSASGHSALMRRRGLLKRVDDGRVIQDGVLGRVALTETKAGFHVDLQDVRARGIKHRVFTRDGTTSLLPRGVVEGYGEFVPGSPITHRLVPPVQPLTGTVVGTSAGYILLDGVGSQGDEVDARLAVPKSIQDILVSRSLYEVWWRTNSGDSWKKLKNISIPTSGLFVSTPAAGVVGIVTRKIRNADGDLTPTTVANTIWFDDFDAGSDAAPSNGASVEVVIVYVGEPSEDAPLHWEGEWGELVAKLLDGDFSDRPPRIRYNAAAVAAIKTPVRIKIPEPRDDLREVLEELHKAVGAAPGLNAAGELAPIRYELPTSTAGLTVLDDDNCQPIPGWEHTADNAITAAEVTYHRDVRVPPDADIEGDVPSDLIVSKPITVRRQAPDSVLDVMGEEVLEIDGWMFRALGGDRGQVPSGDISNEQGWKAAEAAKHRAVDRFVFGGAVSWLKTTEAVELGEWVLDQRSWRPDYSTGDRGGSTLAQVASVREINDAWTLVQLVDAAPEDQQLAEPTLGALSQADSVVTIPVTSIPAGAEAAVQYAIAGSEPAEGSGLWTLADRVDTTGDVDTPVLPSGETVWIRARSEAPGRLPSSWVSGGSIALSTVPTIRRPRVVVAEDGSVTFSWEVPPSMGGLQIEYVVHTTGTAAPAYTDTVEVDADDLAAAFSAGTVAAGQSITADLTPYQGFSGGAVTGTAGTAVTVTASREPSDDTSPGNFLIETADYYTAGDIAALDVEYAEDASGTGATSTYNASIHTHERHSHDGGSTWTAWYAIGRRLTEITVTPQDGAPAVANIEIHVKRHGVAEQGNYFYPLGTGQGARTRTVLLDEKHPVLWRLKVIRSDGGEPIHQSGPTLDYDDAANVSIGGVSYDGAGTATIPFRVDSDVRDSSPQVVAQTSTDDGATWSAWSATGITLDGYEGELELDQSTSADTLVRIAAYNKADELGPPTPARVDRYGRGILGYELVVSEDDPSAPLPADTLYAKVPGGAAVDGAGNVIDFTVIVSESDPGTLSENTIHAKVAAS